MEQEIKQPKLPGMMKEILDQIEGDEKRGLLKKGTLEKAKKQWGALCVKDDAEGKDEE